jgi:hypothetical protein
MTWWYALWSSPRDMIAFRPAPIPAERGVGISRRHDLQRHDGCPFRWSGAGAVRRCSRAGVENSFSSRYAFAMVIVLIAA